MGLEEITKEIQYVLAPAVMVSSAALILLGLQNKFSSLASRFRVLNHEKRNLAQKTERDSLDTARILSLQEQIAHLTKRAYHVRNSVLLSYSAIILFIGTSLLMFLDRFVKISLHNLIIVVFMIGLLMVLGVALSMIIETVYFYKIITIEKEI